jgi:hypothetical protein
MTLPIETLLWVIIAVLVVNTLLMALNTKAIINSIDAIKAQNNAKRQELIERLVYMTDTLRQ